jgi:hypothetical protein
MTGFLVELYIARTDPGAVERAAERVHLAAEEQRRRGTPVRYLRSIFVPEDETCFMLFEATSADAVRDAASAATLPFERIIGAVATEPEPRSPNAGAGGGVGETTSAAAGRGADCQADRRSTAAPLTPRSPLARKEVPGCA